MQRNFYDDELEDFLKRKADQYRMFPADKVWKEIYQALHTGKRWSVAGGLLLLTGFILISSPITMPDTSSRIKNSIHASLFHSISNTVTVKTMAAEKKETIAAIHNFTSTGSSYPLQYSLQPVNEKEEAEINDNEQTTQVNLAAGFPDAIETAKERPANKSIALPAIPLLPEANKKDNAISWLEEKAVIQTGYQQKKRLKLQFYLSPTISYRRLHSSNINRYNQNGAISTNGIKGLVNQDPALGVELGSALLFPVTKNLLLKAGMQLNYVRYTINAYRSSTERTSIMLSSNSHLSAPTTITTYSNIRNLNGTYPATIQNQYVQVSTPLGAEWKVTGKRKLELNLAGSIQPTYLLMNSAYMLTSDYSNYTKEPSLVRRWNVNTGIEAFISYKTGSLRWQVGPQFRYQLLSSYTDRYPIREHLMEYGMKIGVSKTLR